MDVKTAELPSELAYSDADTEPYANLSRFPSLAGWSVFSRGGEHVGYQRLVHRANRAITLRLNSMVRIVATVLPLLSAYIFITPVVWGQETARFDALLEAAKTDELSAEFRSGRIQGQEPLGWLRRRAEQGHAIAQYELASRLGKGSLEKALKWYARARMSRVLDGAECARSNHSAALGWALDLDYQRLETLARENESKFSLAIEEALKWEASRNSRPTAKWICGESTPPSAEGDVLAPSQRQAERREALEQLAARAKDIDAQQRLMAQPINSDRFGILNAPFIGSPIRWLNNEQLYVRLADIDVQPFAARSKRSPAQYLIWNIRTGEVEEANNFPRGKFCYYSGYLSYTRSEEEYVLFIEGPVGEQREIGRRRVREGHKALPLPEEGIRRPNPFNCRWDGPGWLGKALKYPLLEEHGHILVNRYGSELTYVRANGGDPVVLPFNYSDIQSAVYSPALNAYVVPRNINGGAGALTLWLLKPDGTMSSTVFPAGPWFGASRGFHVSRAGIVIWSHRRAGRGDGGFAGIYLSRNNEVARLMSGFVNGSDVSPDGCKIAAGLGHENRRSELKVVNVCKGRD
jgi:hypothetical protein